MRARSNRWANSFQGISGPSNCCGRVLPAGESELKSDYRVFAVNRSRIFWGNQISLSEKSQLQFFAERQNCRMRWRTRKPGASHVGRESGVGRSCHLRPGAVEPMLVRSQTAPDWHRSWYCGPQFLGTSSSFFLRLEAVRQRRELCKKSES